jgi:biotin--protein ligase
MCKSFLKNYQIKTISAAQLKVENWTNDGVLLIMPGGADLPYTGKLNGKGNAIISEYIATGGKYLGICAGAYYGSSSIEFGVGTKLEVVGDRELKLFNGKAIGPAFGKYSYLDNSGAIPAQVVVDPVGELLIFFNGGCYFSAGDCKVISTYSQLNLPAIISVKNNNVILSGVHFEYDPTTLDCSDQYLSLVAQVLLPVEHFRKQLVKYILDLLQL